MSIILAVALLVVSLLLSPLAAEEIDLRDGPRTTFYGARFYRDGVPSTGDFYGWAMAFGDIDGDGYIDFLSSSANSEGPNDTRDHERDVYLFFGRPKVEFPQPRVVLDKKALRQARAKIAAARSRVIGPLQKKVAAEEKRIKEMEAAHAKALADLERASLDGDVARIAELSRAHTNLRADIDSAYDTLAETTDEFERESARFDRELEQT